MSIYIITTSSQVETDVRNLWPPIRHSRNQVNEILRFLGSAEIINASIRRLSLLNIRSLGSRWVVGEICGTA
jgi:hypothetical protein